MPNSIREILDAYSPVFDYVSDAGHGRIRAQLEGVLFQHLLILRRQAVQDAGLNFYQVEQQVMRKIKKLDDLSPLNHILAVYALTMQATGSPGPWNELRDML